MALPLQPSPKTLSPQPQAPDRSPQRAHQPSRYLHLGYAKHEQRLQFNSASGICVDPDDPLLDPTKEPHERRYIPPDEFAAFYKHVKPQHRAVCLAPVATGCRTQELLGLERNDHDPAQQLIFIHQRARTLGGDPENEDTLRPGLKTTKGVRRKTKQQRGRHTLFPAILLTATPTRLHRHLLYPTPTGKVYGQRNFYRDVWQPAAKKAGTTFTIYDLRHTFISHLLANNIPTVEVAAYAGHTTRQLGDLDNTTTRIYQLPTGKHRQAALDAINQYITQALQHTRQRRHLAPVAPQDHYAPAAPQRTLNPGAMPENQTHATLAADRTGDYLPEQKSPDRQLLLRPDPHCH